MTVPAIIVVAWIVIAVIGFIIVGSIVLAIQSRRAPRRLAEQEADREQALASLKADKARGTSDTYVEEDRFN